MKLVTLTRRFIFQFTCLATFAQTTGASGMVEGLIFNPATREYLRNAEIEIEGSQQNTARVTLPTGGTVIRDIDLTSAFDNGATAGAVEKLGEFVVNSGREGNANAIVSQRNLMNVTNSVSSDVCCMCCPRFAPELDPMR